MFGGAIYGREDGDWRWQRWRESVRTLRETGNWDSGRWIPLMPFVTGTELPDYTWTIRGEEVWRWAGSEWDVAEPQPEMTDKTDGFRVGTVCAERNECLDEPLIDHRHNVCGDCGKTTEIGWGVAGGWAQM